MIDYNYNETVKKLENADYSVLYSSADIGRQFEDVCKAYADAAAKNKLSKDDYSLAVLNGFLLAKMYYEGKAQA